MSASRSLTCTKFPSSVVRAIPSDEAWNAPRNRPSLSRSSSTSCRRCSSSFELRSTLLTNSAIKRVVSTASSSKASGLLPRIASTPTTCPSRCSGAQMSDRAPSCSVARRSTRGSVVRVAGVHRFTRHGDEAREACVPADPQADVTSGDPGAVVDDRVSALEPLHRGAVRAGQALCPGDDRRRDRVGVELERRDLLLRLHDLVQTAQARPQPLLVPLAPADVSQGDVDAAVGEQPAGELRLERGAVLPAVPLLTAELALLQQPLVQSVEVVAIGRVDQLAGLPSRAARRPCARGGRRRPRWRP